MGKRSTKENKTIFQQARESLNLTRQQASERLEFISSDRLEKLENEKTQIHPEEVVALSKAYKMPELCHDYCSHNCAIGKIYEHDIQEKPISQITLELIALMNDFQNEKDCLIALTVDGQITKDEYTDFQRIQNNLNEIEKTIDTLKLWIDKRVLEGQIDEEAFIKK